VSTLWTRESQRWYQSVKPAVAYAAAAAHAVDAAIGARNELRYAVGSVLTGLFIVAMRR
jgi:hypothetical protein